MVTKTKVGKRMSFLDLHLLLSINYTLFHTQLS